MLMVRHRMKGFRERLVSFWIYITSNFDSGTDVIGLRKPEAGSFPLLSFAQPGLTYRAAGQPRSNSARQPRDLSPQFSSQLVLCLASPLLVKKAAFFILVAVYKVR